MREETGTANRVEEALVDAMWAYSPSQPSAKMFSRVVEKAAKRLFEERAEDVLSEKTKALMARTSVQEAEGGSLSSNEAARILGISRQAVDEKRKRKKLVAWRMTDGKWRYPAWQFSEAGVLPGIEKCLGALAYDDQASVLDFFLLPSERLGGKRPLDLMRAGKVAEAVESARSFGVYG